MVASRKPAEKRSHLGRQQHRHLLRIPGRKALEDRNPFKRDAEITLEMGFRLSTKCPMVMQCALPFQQEIAGRKLLVLAGKQKPTPQHA
ncbi:hypothetical protein AVEN_173522-1 [Araneus ventricosus]|uniref:Uncharacterized protein n=1 Tax=Araneus ventricosus TaxID=182803 RepID=A0A4Y2N3G9_ARAVE|nr:hypothetical protein AVEN_173522-1 [Araneus ventricosus]